jgi:signal transduction histidine kinase
LSLLERRRAQVAHDASGPATGMLAAIETVLEYEPIPDSSRSLLEDSRVGLRRLTRLLTDRSDALAQPSNVVEGSLPTLLRRSALPSIEGLDLQGRLHVEVRAPQGEARLDLALIEGVLATLLSNAWTCRRGQAATVEIEAAFESGVLWISVTDDGRGLDCDTLLRAGALGFAHRPNGVGIGLFQLRRALERRGGALVIQSLPRGARASVLFGSNALPAAD